MNRLLLALFALTLLGCRAHTPARAQQPSVVAAADEPGERLDVRGTVYAADGSTPVEGARVYVYQTDARGYYALHDAMDNEHPRLHATMQTGAGGRYAYRTIRPGPYPGGGVPAHVHYVVSAPGYRERIFEIVFDDDPLVDARIRAQAAREGSMFALCAPERDDEGTWHCTQDVRLQPR